MPAVRCSNRSGLEICNDLENIGMWIVPCADDVMSPVVAGGGLLRRIRGIRPPEVVAISLRKEEGFQTDVDPLQ